MAETCPACSHVVDDTGVAGGGLLRCDKCGTRFPKAKPVEAKQWSTRDAHGERGAGGELGIHPALARKYGRQNSVPDGAPVEDAPAPPPALPVEPPKATRVLAPPQGEILDSTNPGRPVGRAPERGGPKVPAAPLEPLPRIPGYEVTDLVGKGAMGRVYRARQNKTGKWAAVKILATELASRQDFIARFEREGAAMRAVDHPGVVVVLDQGSSIQPDGSEAHYIAMEFIEGHPLRRHLELAGRGQPLDPPRALRFARKIVQALGAAHARGVIHRDLKPENILVLGPDGDERLVLVDFGLAGILDEENDPHPNLTKSRMTMGTVNYMAPEQRTDAKRVDQRADLYAAGVIFYELLTGDLPLGRFALPTERGTPVPLSVDKCIVRALARSQDERYQYAGQLDEDLRQIEQELARTTGRDTIVGPMTSPKRGPTSKREARDEEVITTGDVLSHGLPSGNGSTAMLAPYPSGTWIKRSAIMWSIGALVVGTLLGLLALRGGCAL